MGDVPDILAAADRVAAAGEAATLATVVRVQGSSYRLPGARLLVDATGRRAGSVSGGCLEADVARRGRLLSTANPVATVRYDAADLDAAGDDVAWGFNLGCDGSIEILIERLADADACGLGVLRRSARDRIGGALVHVFRGDRTVTPGARVFAGTDGTVDDPDGVFGRLPDLKADADAVRATGTSATVTYGPVHALVEAVQPPLPLVIFGGGHDAGPLVRAGKMLGWHVTVCDRRAGHARADRFPGADVVVCAAAADVPSRLPLSADTAAVVMTHHYPEDRALLRVLLASPARYVGALGPRTRTERILAELTADRARFDPAALGRLRAPVGLDLGGDGAEAVAVAIVAEVLAATHDRPGGPLRLRAGPIHTPAVDRVR